MDTITLNSLGVTLSEQPLISSTSGKPTDKSPKILIHRKHFRYPNGTNHATYTIPITEHAVLVKELNPDTEYAFYLNGTLIHRKIREIDNIFQVTMMSAVVLRVKWSTRL